MHVDHLWLTDFRSYAEAEFAPAPEGLTVVSGANGEGKTNLVEAIAYLATLKSFRGSPGETLVRGARPGEAAVDKAVVRAEGSRESRRVLVEAEVNLSGRDRVQVNGQPLKRSRDLLGFFQVTVFSPDDLSLVKGGPQERRRFLDDLLVALHPRHDDTITEVERVLKQRNALLKSAGGPGAASGRIPPDVESTLDVWDAKLAAAGEKLASVRASLTAALEPFAGDAYARLASSVSGAGKNRIRLEYQRSWDGPLADALTAARRDDLRRGVTTVGPHRDELDMYVGGFPARTHASQGEQRSLTLALRVAGHHLVTDRIGSSPILLLDDVFSELDAARSESLLACLPGGQAIVTTAGAVPDGAEVAARFRVEGGKVLK
ncbi:MAG TPA: DNA replication/repair protein RecF [Acidimicrobiales bacterium]|nr:DNA replication/repair protein RecF [Acidimicrobiales bacterium]